MFHVEQKFEVIVIGAGHAGCEAALASSRMKRKTLLVSMDLFKCAEMSCNPSIGGIGKGQLVKELDALGGEMGKNADITGIQFRRLNTRKGSAVQSTRCQSDKELYAQNMQQVLKKQPFLELLEGEVKNILVEDEVIKGISIRVESSIFEILSESVVITAGTFMEGLLHCGNERKAGGRYEETASFGLSKDLRKLGFDVFRLKTGTPPRLKRESIDFSVMKEQLGDEFPLKFSFWDTEIKLPQVSCFLSFTNTKTHAVISENLHRSPLYSGIIRGIGPRYCPSIEDKVVKFPQKDRHQIFFEPLSLNSNWIYPNGISTSLPPDVQEAFLKTIPGCEKVEFIRHGYAVEYDVVSPAQLKPTLETKKIKGLFLAGQVNGTTGYEEAAAQGLVAGVNAALFAHKEQGQTFSRATSYIGVMVDDLTTLGVTEPYRMFTSRAEFRLSLREDNADERLSPLGYELGLLSKEQFESFKEKKHKKEGTKEYFKKTFVKYGDKSENLSQLLKRPEISIEDVLLLSEPPFKLESLLKEALEIEIKYEGYIEMQKIEVDRLKRMDKLLIPENLDFWGLDGLSYELKEKLSKKRPQSLSEVSKISGVTPAALSVLIHVLSKKQKEIHTSSH